MLPVKDMYRHVDVFMCLFDETYDWKSYFYPKLKHLKGIRFDLLEVSSSSKLLFLKKYFCAPILLHINVVMCYF